MKGWNVQVRVTYGIAMLLTEEQYERFKNATQAEREKIMWEANNWFPDGQSPEMQSDHIDLNDPMKTEFDLDAICDEYGEENYTV